MTASLIMALLLATAFAPGAAPADISSLRAPGISVPKAPLPNVAGGSISLESSGKRPTVLVVFASWCDPCQKHLPAIVRLARATSARFIGIDALESLSKAKAVVTKYHVPFPVALLTAAEFERAGVTDEQRGATGLDIPAVYVIDVHGLSYEAFVGGRAANVSAIEAAIHAAARKG